MSYNVRSVLAEGKKVNKLIATPRNKPDSKIKIKTCPKNQLVEPWKKYKKNKFRAVDGKLFATKKEMKAYNQMYQPKAMD